MKIKLPDMVFPVLGLALLTLGWEILGRNFSGLVITGPSATLAALLDLLQDKTFILMHLMPSLKRILLSLALGIGSGLVLGVLSGLVKPLRLMLAPVRWILTSIPVVVILVIFMLWFGMGTTMVVNIAATMIAPVVYVNISQAMMSVDNKLLEMSVIYHFPLSMRLGRIYVMALSGPVFASAVLATGNAIRLIILAEMFGANEGVGHVLAISRSSLQTEKLYALALLAMLIIGTLELVLLGPLRKMAKKRQL